MFSFREVLSAIQSYGKAHQFIMQHKLWKWILIPGIIYCLLFFTGFYFVWGYSGDFVEYLTRLLHITEWVQDLESSWLSFLFILVAFSVRIVFVFWYFSYFKYLFLIVASPVFSYLSEKTEAILEYREFPFSWAQLGQDIWRGIRMSFRNIIYQTGAILILLVVSFIPVVGWITPMIGFFIEAYFYGFSMMDYSCERHRLSMAQSIQFIRQHRGMALGNGMVFYIFMLVPVVGWMLAPSYAVIAATIDLQHKKLI
ncbi:EI24 domain-containing protein [Chitinophaga oryzae]|uniref:EI24 domain-containing protein n=2 Tax=Chitinophaga oryzae TaxID=2725414 RepID=A0AAE6ZKV8_9BACT|nr:EI24 domain-containing protein [Chitinophaga oryzae]QJB40526.1 EI24 domain-containing protein [Chitinophaga oryzae]